MLKKLIIGFTPDVLSRSLLYECSPESSNKTEHFISFLTRHDVPKAMTLDEIEIDSAKVKQRKKK